MRTGVIPAALAPLFFNFGCLSPVALGTMETTGNEAPVVFNHFSRGEAVAFFVAKFDVVVAATQCAAQGLLLDVSEKKIKENQPFFRCHDAMNDRVDSLIVRRSETVTSIKYDVGWFGSVGFGRLMLRQLTSELRRS